MERPLGWVRHSQNDVLNQKLRYLTDQAKPWEPVAPEWANLKQAVQRAMVRIQVIWYPAQNVG